jgi:hypothetical protein
MPRDAAAPAIAREGEPQQIGPGEGSTVRISAADDILARLAAAQRAARARSDLLGLRLIEERRLAAYQQLQRRRRCRLVDLAADRRTRSGRT